jgi:hypothetical protein
MFAKTSLVSFTLSLTKISGTTPTRIDIIIPPIIITIASSMKVNPEQSLIILFKSDFLIQNKRQLLFRE